MAEMLTLKGYLDAGGALEEVPDKYLAGITPLFPGETARVFAVPDTLMHETQHGAFYDVEIEDGAVRCGKWWLAHDDGTCAGFILTSMGLSTRRWRVILMSKESIKEAQGN